MIATKHYLVEANEYNNYLSNSSDNNDDSEGQNWLIGKINRTIIILSLYRSILKNKRKVNINDKA